MPLPTPRQGEPERAFISRCMGSDVMQREFGDQRRRAAVCYSQLRGKRGKGAGRRPSPKVHYTPHPGPGPGQE